MTEENQLAKIGEVAKNTLPQTVSQADGAISTVVGLFNNVVLYPLKKWNLTFKYKLESFEADLKKRMETIPQGNLQSPPLMIIGPTLEGLKYTLDEDQLRDMYVNLLASSMDSRKNTVVHPSYVDIIKQMDAYDAKLFAYLAKQVGYIKAINPHVGIKDTNKYYVRSMPDWFIEYDDGQSDIFQTSASLVRLAKFGLIDLMYDRNVQDENAGYQVLANSKSLLTILEKYQNAFPDKVLYLNKTDSIVNVNDYGYQFAKACLPE